MSNVEPEPEVREDEGSEVEVDGMGQGDSPDEGAEDEGSDAE
jgi:hypothetical protein